jgi:predicted Fe-Mo cluster-binding NifX family protein
MYITSSLTVTDRHSATNSTFVYRNEEHMSKIGVMMSSESADGQMSSHFGKAEWIMVSDADNAVSVFVKNDGLNGRCAAEIVIGHGCTDVILADIGDGALGHLQEASIRVWAVPELLAGDEALRLFRDAKLSPVPATRTATRHGNCCGGHGSSEASSCCRSEAGAEAHGCCRG